MFLCLFQSLRLKLLLLLLQCVKTKQQQQPFACETLPCANYTVVRCLNRTDGRGHYLISNDTAFAARTASKSMWNERLVLRGRLTGFIVQEFTVRPFKNSDNIITGAILAFHVPVGFRYSAFAAVEYADFTGVKTAVFNGGREPALFQDSFSLKAEAEATTNVETFALSLSRRRLCSFSSRTIGKDELQDELVADGFWLLPEPMLSPNSWHLGANAAL